MKTQFVRAVLFLALITMSSVQAIEITIPMDNEQASASAKVFSTAVVEEKIAQLETSIPEGATLIVLTFRADPPFRGRYQESFITVGYRDSEGKVTVLGDLYVRLFTDPTIGDSVQFFAVEN